jgi:hypothetical protein
MMSYKHFSIDEWVVLKELLISKLFKKKNGKVNFSKITKRMGRNRSIILRDIK